MMSNDALEVLEIRLSAGRAGSYSVSLRLGEREFPSVALDPALLHDGDVGQLDEGVRLFNALTASDVLRSAWDQAGALHPRRRIRLHIDDDASELHALAWEALRDPSPTAEVSHLAADSETPFSRHVASASQPPGPLVGPLRVLTAVAAPTNCADYGLAPVRRADEEASLAATLAAAPPGYVEHTALAGPCTLKALSAALERGYDVLHLVAHGAVNSDRTAGTLFLEADDGTVERVDIDRFARTIDCLDRSLRLVMLMSCNTAARNPSDPGFGFAPALLAAGVPAVVAMQDRVPMPTAAAFTRAFYDELWESGQVDHAANRARREIFAERLPGSAVPALYATNAGLSLWTGPREALQQPHAPAEPSSASAVDPAPAGTWEEFGGTFEDLQVVVGPGGCMHAFALDDAHVLRHRRELTPGGAWGEWKQLATDAKLLAVTCDPRGRITVAMTDSADVIRYCVAEPDGTWREWNEKVGYGSALAVTTHKDGRLVLVAEHKGIVWCREEPDRDQDWKGWVKIGDGSGRFELARNLAGHVILGGLLADGTLVTTILRRPGGKWEPWTKLGGGCIHASFTRRARTGVVYLFVVDVEHVILWTWETSPGEPWVDFDVAGTLADFVVAGWRSDQLEILAIDSRAGEVFHIDTTPDNPEWELLASGGGVVALRAVSTPRDTVEVFALHESGRALRLVRPASSTRPST